MNSSEFWLFYKIFGAFYGYDNSFAFQVTIHNKNKTKRSKARSPPFTEIVV